MTPPADAIARLKALRESGIACDLGQVGCGCEGCNAMNFLWSRPDVLDALLALPDLAPQAETARCATCKHWRRLDPTVQGGRCLQGIGQGNMDARTLHDFGCVNHRPDFTDRWNKMALGITDADVPSTPRSRRRAGRRESLK